MKKTFHISGMHCASCEILLEKELKNIEGVKPLKISHKKGEIKVDFSQDEKEKSIVKTIQTCGFKVVEEAKDKKMPKNTLTDYLQIIVVFLGILIVFQLLKNIEISKFFPDLDKDVSILIALVLGLVASVSTCLALVGGIVIGFGGTYSEKEDKKHLFLSRAIPHIYFHIGRVGGFALLGGLLGLIGSKINYSLTFTGYFTILIGIVMLYLGLQILNVVPNITKLGFHLPKFLSKKVHSLENNNHHFAPILIGVLTFFLPCGFTQSMQLAAVASQSFLSGALIMGAFALGTLPVLISLGIGSTYAQKSKFSFAKKILGVVVIFFAFYSLNSGFVLTGINLTLPKISNTPEQTSEITTDQGVQIVKMDVDWTFKPTEFRVKKGIPVRWEINGINVSGCSNEVVIPSLNLSQKIIKGKINVLEFTPTKTGVLPFSCRMGMLKGRFIVE